MKHSGFENVSQALSTKKTCSSLDQTCPGKRRTDSVTASVTNTHAIITDRQLTMKTRNVSGVGIFLFSSCWRGIFIIRMTKSGVQQLEDYYMMPWMWSRALEKFWKWRVINFSIIGSFLSVSFLPSGHFRTACWVVYSVGKHYTAQPQVLYLLCASCPQRSLKNPQFQSHRSSLVIVTFTDTEPLEKLGEAANRQS